MNDNKDAPNLGGAPTIPQPFAARVRRAAVALAQCEPAHDVSFDLLEPDIQDGYLEMATAVVTALAEFPFAHNIRLDEARGKLVLHHRKTGQLSSDLLDALCAAAQQGAGSTGAPDDQPTPPDEFDVRLLALRENAQKAVTAAIADSVKRWADWATECTCADDDGGTCWYRLNEDERAERLALWLTETDVATNALDDFVAALAAARPSLRAPSGWPKLTPEIRQAIVRCEEEINAERMGEQTANVQMAFDHLLTLLGAASRVPSESPPAQQDKNF